MDISILDSQRVMAIIRHNTPFDVSELFQAVLSAGINTIEITLNTPQAIQLIARGAREIGKEMCIGAGSVLDIESAKKAIDSGAKFIVSPVFIPELVRFCKKEKIPSFPGVATPTEAFNAHAAGAHMVKLFPASTFGPAYITSIKAPLDRLEVIAVGGITSANIIEYFTSGADAVAIGAGVIKPEWIGDKNYQAITDNIRRLMKAVGQK